ncbi:MAG: nitroreductase [Chloroflexi bacterium]|nr:nitroreductase [Chloroflexota bacterium]
MDTLQAIADRRSIRRYERQPLPPEDLAKILEAARLAPSARNRQPWHLVVVSDGAQKTKLAALCLGQLWLAGAGAMLVGVALPKVSEKWCVVDATIAMQNAVLAATALGYGTCWIGAFHEGGVKALLGIPEEANVVAILPIGVPAEQPGARSRKPLAELVSADRYGQGWDG